MLKRIWIIAVALVSLNGGVKPAAAAQLSAQKPNDYRKASSWLCRPYRKDACYFDLTTTFISSDGKLSQEAWAADPQAPIDCFYVYPTVSTDRQPNSDMNPDPAELNVVQQQFARFA